MLSDLNTIHTALGRSIDDVIVLVHLLLTDALAAGPIGFQGDAQLHSKQARQQWEAEFVHAFITPLLHDVNTRLQHANNDMVNDDRLGNNPLLRMLYEVDGDVSTPAVDIIDVPALWRYRARVSLEHVKRQLDEQRAGNAPGGAAGNAPGGAGAAGGARRRTNQTSPFPVLELFFREEHYLHVLCLLPSIMTLHRLLVMKYNRSIDHAEATSMTIGTFLEGITEDNVRAEYRELINDFILAWNNVRHSFVNYVFGGRTLPVEYIEISLSEQSPLAILLPSLRGYGLCSVALTYLLCQKQNDFLEAYSTITKYKLDAAAVDVRDAGHAQLISFHRQRDLQPIILANCNYSLELGKGTRIEYDFGSMERQVEERFIRGRPRLQYQVDFVLFREDFTSAAIFAELRSRIPQESLVNGASIEKEIGSKFVEVGDLLASLDITVGFLVSVGGDPNSSLVKFMTETLQMSHRRQLYNVMQSCRLKHVESLWLLLSFMKACMQSNYGQDAFDAVEEKYREKMSSDLVDKVRIGLQHVNIDSFLPALHECILFKMTVKQDPNHEDYIDNVDQPLNYVLHEYMEERGMAAMPALLDGRFPAEVLVKHCVALWRVAHRPQRRLR